MSRSNASLPARRAPQGPAVVEPIGEDFYAAVVETWSRSRSPHTVRARCGDLASFARSAGFADEAPAAVLAELIRVGPFEARRLGLRWLEEMAEEGLAKSTMARRTTSVRSLVQEAHDEYGLAWTLRVRPPKFDAFGAAEGPPAKRVQEVVADLQRRGAHRDLAIVLLLFDSGLRRAEVAAVRICDIDPNRDGEPAVRVTRKGNRIVWRTMSKRCLRAIKRWLASNGLELGKSRRWLLFSTDDTNGRPSDHLGASQVYNVVRAVGLGNPHGLRHSGATELARVTGDLFLVQEFLDHANAATTQVYVNRMQSKAAEGTSILSGEAKTKKGRTK